MAIFDVKCESCEYSDTVLVRIRDSLPTCPICGGPLEKVIVGSNLGFDLKGTGYYATDFKTKK